MSFENMTRLIVLLLVLMSAGTVSFSQATAFDSSKLPQTANRPEQFVGAGWKIEGISKGDLNRDGKTDYAIKLIEDKPKVDGEGFDSDRLLVIAVSDERKLRRAAFSNKLLQCTSCGGAFYGAGSAPGVALIDKGVIIVENEHGSREVSRSTFKFRFDQESGRFVLIGYDYWGNDRLTGVVTTESTNYITGNRITKTGKGKTAKTARSRVKVENIYLEDIDGDEFEFAALERLGLG